MYVSTAFATIFLSTVLGQTLAPTLTISGVVEATGDNTISYGTCESPEITFSAAAGMFSVLNPSSYPVGSNSNITSLTSVIVLKLNTTCGANSYTVGLAADGEADVGAFPQGAAQADAWNSRFRIFVSSIYFIY
jgi:hypothetical protein